MTLWPAAHVWAALCILAVMAPGSGARAQSPARATEAVFDTAARIGASNRAVRVRFLCTANDGPNIQGALIVSLEIPRHEQLKTVFDFDKFEGPDANAGPLSHLRVNGVRGKAGNRFTAAGSYPGDGASPPFAFQIAAGRRDAASLARLSTVLRPLLDGPGQFVWLQGNTRKGGVSIEATLDLPPERAERLKTVLAPCLSR